MVGRLRPDRYNSRKILDLFISLGIFALVALFPLLRPVEYWLSVVTVSMYYALCAMGWNLLAGYTGQYSIAPAAFALIGAYTSALATKYLGVSPVWGVGLATLAAGLTGFALGRAALRLRGAYLALTTVAFAEIVRYVVRNSYSVTRGNLGLSVPPLFEGGDVLAYYYTFLAVCLLVQLLLWVLIHSRIGLYLQAIREDEVCALGRGVNVVWWKSFAFALSNAICGLAGALYVHFLQLAAPKMGLIMESGLMIMAAVFGGIGTLVGPFVGGLVVKPLAEFARAFNVQHMLILGFAGIIIMRFFREGLYGFLSLIVARLLGTRSPVGRSARDRAVT